MRPPGLIVSVIGITLVLSASSCADIDGDAPGIDPAAGASESITLQDPIASPTALADGLDASGTARSGATGSGSAGLCSTGEPIAATVTNVDEWVRLRSTPSLDGEELVLLPVESMVTAWPDTLTWDGSDFWWVAVEDPATGDCGHVAGYYLTAQTGRLDAQLQGLGLTAPGGEWDLAPLGQAGGLSWSSEGSFVTAAVVDSSIEEWVAAERESIDAFLASTDGAGFSAPPEILAELDVSGADRAIRPGVGPSDDGISQVVLAEVGDRLVVLDSFRRNDPARVDLIETIDDFLNSLVITDRVLLGA